MSLSPNYRGVTPSNTSPGISYWAWLWPQLRSHSWACGGALALQGLASLCAMTLPWALSQVVKAMQAGGGVATGLPPNRLGLPLWTGVAVFAALVALEAGLARGAESIQVRVRPRMRLAAVHRLYAHLQGHSHRYFIERPVGALAHRVSETAQATAQVIWSGISEFWPMAVVLLSALGVLLAVDVLLGVFFIAWVLLWLGGSWYHARGAQALTRRAAQARSATNGTLADVVINHNTVRSFAREADERALLQLRQQAELTLVQAANQRSLALRWWQYGFAALFKVAVLLYALHLWQGGRAGVPEFVWLASLSFVVIHETRQMGRRLQDAMEAAAQMATGLDELMQAHELPDRPGALALLQPRGDIEFSGVWFGYDPNYPVLKGLSVRIPAGQRVGLVGFSGSGKSTFVNLLQRMYDVQDGQVRLDGHDVRGLTQASVHAAVAVVPQEPLLFHRSVRENLAYGSPSASDAEIQRSAQQAMAVDFVASWPGGWATPVGERGVKLSGGQRQRIALARALLKNASVMVLDEATSSLDNVTERAVQANLDNPMADRTVLVIAHRLSTVAHLDRILVLDNGRVVEDGDHAALLLQGGLYARLWNQQSHGCT